MNGDLVPLGYLIASPALVPPPPSMDTSTVVPLTAKVLPAPTKLMLATVEAILVPPELMPTVPRSFASCLAFDRDIVLFDYLSGVCLSTIQVDARCFCPGTVDVSLTTSILFPTGSSYLKSIG